MSKRGLSLVGLDELATPAAATAKGVQRVTPPADVGAPDPEALVVTLPLSSISPNPNQPRRTFEPARLEELAASIKELGRVLQPITVRPAPDGTGFELIAGERRCRASELAGLTSIRAIIDGVDDATSAEMALIENMARDDLSPMEEARGCAALRDNFGYTVTAIAKRCGRDRTAVSHLIRLLDLPDRAQELIADGQLSEGHGRVLLRLSDFDAQRIMAERCADGGWSVRELERQVDARLNPVTSATVKPGADQLALLEDLADRLAPLCGESPVKIRPHRHGSYEILVRCEDLDALNATVSRLSRPGKRS